MDFTIVSINASRAAGEIVATLAQSCHTVPVIPTGVRISLTIVSEMKDAVGAAAPPLVVTIIDEAMERLGSIAPVAVSKS